MPTGNPPGFEVELTPEPYEKAVQQSRAASRVCGVLPASPGSSGQWAAGAIRMGTLPMTSPVETSVAVQVITRSAGMGPCNCHTAWSAARPYSGLRF